MGRVHVPLIIGPEAELLLPTLEGNQEFVAFSAGYYSLALLNDGSIIAWGDNKNKQCEVVTLVRSESRIWEISAD